MNRVCNFSAGPSTLPEWVLKEATDDMLNFRNGGQPVMKMSHRSSEFIAVMKNVHRRLKELLRTSNNYRALFLQNGASTQLAVVALNLMTKSRKSNYITIGQWSVNALADENFSYISNLKYIEFDLDADYVHITLNNTIYGTACEKLPPTRVVSLVANASSCILSATLNNGDLLSAIKFKSVEKYVTDFAYEELIDEEDAITFPHLSASTPESEDNYTSMANSIVINYLELWTIHNIISKISTKLLEFEYNIANMVNKFTKDMAYSIFDKV